MTAECRHLTDRTEGPLCSCFGGACALGIPSAWWLQYEDTARALKLMGDAYPAGSPERRLLYTADDDIRTLVDGLRQYERERGVPS